MIFINLIGTEKFFAMEPKTRTKEEPVASRPTRRLPNKFICIDPSEAPQVIDWLNGAGVVGDREVVEVHLRLCFHCQEVVVHRMQIDEEFKKRAGRCLHLSSHDEHRIGLVHETGARSNCHDDCDHANPSKSMKVGGQG